MKTAYLIYHDDGEYDSQIYPRIICETRERAEDIVAEICIFGQKLGRQLFDEFYDENGEILSDELYPVRCESNRLTWSLAKWPYNWEASSFDFEVDWNNRPHKRFKPENLKIQELPLI